MLAVMVHAMNCYLTHEYAFTALIVPEIKTFWFAPSAGGMSLYALCVMSSGLMLVYVLVDLCAGRPLSMPVLRLVPYSAALLLLLALLAYHWELAGVRHLR